MRLSALWAYGFAGGEDAEGLLLRQAECEPNERARASLGEMTKCLVANEGSWWKI